MRAWSFLKPKGRLFAIMAAGIVFRENRKTVAARTLIENNGCIHENPDGSFKPSGTSVRTVTVALDKPVGLPGDR